MAVALSRFFEIKFVTSLKNSQKQKSSWSKPTAENYLDILTADYLSAT
jgi:hypothetical protein